MHSKADGISHGLLSCFLGFFHDGLLINYSKSFLAAFFWDVIMCRGASPDTKRVLSSV